MSSPIPSPWLTLAEAAAYGRCSKEHMRRLLASGEVEGSQTGTRGSWIVHVESVDAWRRGEAARPVPTPIVTRHRRAS